VADGARDAGQDAGTDVGSPRPCLRGPPGSAALSRTFLLS
jgi:hypothetical protein